MVGGQPLANVRRFGERHKIVRHTDSGLGVDARAGPGGLSSPEALLIRPLPHDLVMGEISHAGSQHIPLFYFLRQPDLIQSQAFECSVEEF